MLRDLHGTAAGLGSRIWSAIVLAWRATGRGFIEFYQSENLTFSASIAYYTLLSIFPFLLIILAIISRLAVVQAGDESAVVELLGRALPSNFNFLSEQIVQLQRSPVSLTIAGTLITLWAAMGVFGALTSAVNHAWGTDKPYSFWQHKLVAFIMMMAAGVLFTVAVLLASAGQFQHTRVIATLTYWFPFLSDLPNVLMRNSLFPASVLSVGLIYYFAPNTRVRLRDVWYGALLAASLWHLALAGFSWYLRGFSRFDMHGSVGTVVAFLVWVYLSAVILLYGVEVTAAYARLRLERALEKAKVANAEPSGA